MPKELIFVLLGLLGDYLAKQFGVHGDAPAAAAPPAEPPISPAVEAMPTPEELDAQRKAAIAGVAAMSIDAIDTHPTAPRLLPLTRAAFVHLYNANAAPVPDAPAAEPAAPPPV